MSLTPTLDYPSPTSTPHVNHDTIFAAGQPVATNISTGKKGLAGSIIAGAIIGGLVVALLLAALFFALRHRHRRSKGQTASTMEASPENESEKEKCAESNESSHGHYLSSVATCPSPNTQGAQSDITVSQTVAVPNLPRPQKSFDTSQGYPGRTNYSNITTHAPRPRCYKTGQMLQDLDPNSPPCPCCTQSPPVASPSVASGPSAYSPKGGQQTYYAKSYFSSTSPPLPPGAMPPVPSPTLQLHERSFQAFSPPQSPPPQSPSSPGGSTIRRWLMSPLSRSESIRTALPPYEQPAPGLRRGVPEKKEKEKEKDIDETAFAASTYAFM